MIEARKPAVFLQLKCAEIYCFGTKLLLFLINGSCYCSRNNWKILYSFQKCAGWEHMDNKVRKWCGAELPLLTAKGGVHPIRPYQKDVNGALVTGIERQPKWPCRADQIKSSKDPPYIKAQSRPGHVPAIPTVQRQKAGQPKLAKRHRRLPTSKAGICCLRSLFPGTPQKPSGQWRRAARNHWGLTINSRCEVKWVVWKR